MNLPSRPLLAQVEKLIVFLTDFMTQPSSSKSFLRVPCFIKEYIQILGNPVGWREICPNLQGINAFSRPANLSFIPGAGLKIIMQHSWSNDNNMMNKMSQYNERTQKF